MKVLVYRTRKVELGYSAKFRYTRIRDVFGDILSSEYLCPGTRSKNGRYICFAKLPPKNNQLLPLLYWLSLPGGSRMSQGISHADRSVVYRSEPSYVQLRVRVANYIINYLMKRENSPPHRFTTRVSEL